MFLTLLLNHLNRVMAKQKNGDNKAKHTKLLNQKKNKKKQQKELNKIRLKEIARLANKQTRSED